MKQADHGKYVEIECCTIVESLRAIRDEYRNYLKDAGCKPISEMYWVVFRFGVVQYAVMVLRQIAAEYVICSDVPSEVWEILYGSSFLPKFPALGDQVLRDEPENPSPQTVKGQINGLVLEQAFLRVLDGGPFGYEGQTHLTRRYPAFSFWGPDLNFQQILHGRQLLWKKSYPWTKGLAQLFNGTQEELNFQYSQLAEETKRLESTVKLSTFEKIAYEHLGDMRRNTASSRNFSKHDWLRLLEALDNSDAVIDQEFRGTSRRVLAALLDKGHKISGWQDCYQFKGGVQLKREEYYVLRRQVTREIQNAAKRAAYHLGRVKTQSVDSGRHGRSERW